MAACPGIIQLLPSLAPSSDEPYSQALKGTPTCHIFACPMENVCPYHALVPYGPSREPGLILLSVKGEFRFWDSIGIGLAGGEHYSSTLLDLVGSEYISNFIRADVSRLHPSEALKSIRQLRVNLLAPNIHSNNFHRPSIPPNAHLLGRQEPLNTPPLLPPSTISNACQLPPKSLLLSSYLPARLWKHKRRGPRRENHRRG
jgi:nuclear pore complex protein Nup133